MESASQITAFLRKMAAFEGTVMRLSYTLKTAAPRRKLPPPIAVPTAKTRLRSRTAEDKDFDYVIDGARKRIDYACREAHAPDETMPIYSARRFHAKRRSLLAIVSL